MKKFTFPSILITIVLMIVFTNTANSADMEENTKRNSKFTIPQGFVGVRFAGNNDVKPVDLSSAEAKKIKSQVDAAYRKDYNKPGHVQWFFKEFDEKFLFFFTARYTPNPVKGRRPWGTYVTEAVYRVKRSKEAEKSLGVHALVQFYESGEHGVKGGMTPEEVVSVLGKPLEIIELGPFGSFDYVYAKVKVRFLDDRVAVVSKTYPYPTQHTAINPAAAAKQ